MMLAAHGSERERTQRKFHRAFVGPPARGPDAMIVAAGEPIAHVGSDDGGDLNSLTRRRGRVSYFMDAARLAARAAMRAGNELDPHRKGA